jgi:hypothetical protein
MYAEGFRNPFGLRVRADGKVWLADNGADAQGGFPETPDLLYADVKQGDAGRFPPPGQPGAPTPTNTPYATVGSHVAPAGFDFVARGPHRGDPLIALAGTVSAGRRLTRVNVHNGSVNSFLTGFDLVTEVAADPFGRLLVADHDASAVYLLTPPPDGDANLNRIVDITDLGILASNWQTSGDWSKGDFDRNGFIDITDLGILATNWQAGASFGEAATIVGLATIPEPTAACWLCTIPVAVLSRRARRTHTPVISFPRRQVG